MDENCPSRLPSSIDFFPIFVSFCKRPLHLTNYITTTSDFQTQGGFTYTILGTGGPLPLPFPRKTSTNPILLSRDTYPNHGAYSLGPLEGSTRRRYTPVSLYYRQILSPSSESSL